AEAVAATFAQVLLKRAEVRRAALRLHHHLAVEKGCHHRQPLERLLQRGKLGRPIEPAARLEPYTAAVDAGQQAIAVELDLVHPGLRGWCTIGRRGELRLDEGGQRTGSCAADRDGVRPLGSADS